MILNKLPIWLLLPSTFEYSIKNLSSSGCYCFDTNVYPEGTLIVFKTTELFNMRSKAKRVRNLKIEAIFLGYKFIKLDSILMKLHKNQKGRKNRSNDIKLKLE